MNGGSSSSTGCTTLLSAPPSPAGVTAEAYFKILLDNLHDGVYFVDRHRRITYWNKAAERISGFSAEDVLGSNCADNLLNHADGGGCVLCQAACPLANTLQDGQPREADVFLRHKLGHRLPVNVRISPIRDEAGEIVGAVEWFCDASHKHEMLNELDLLQRETLKDPLTGMGNRRFAVCEFDRRLREHVNFGTSLGLLFIDIDHFKFVNDTYGHDMGDRTLALVARSISSALRGADKVCRWGGEEFVAFVPGVSREAFKNIAERVRALVEAATIDVVGAQLKVTVSVGGTFACESDSLETLVARADALMYQAKSRGRNLAVID